MSMYHYFGFFIIFFLISELGIKKIKGDFVRINDSVQQVGEKVAQLDDAMEKVDLDVAKLSDTLIGTRCESAPCMNDGTCIDVKNNTFLCLCAQGYSGVTCNTSKSRSTHCPLMSN